MSSTQKQSGDIFHPETMAGFSPQRTQSVHPTSSHIYKNSGYPRKTNSDTRVCTTPYELDEVQQNIRQSSLSPGRNYSFSPLVVSQDIRFADYAQQTWDTEMLTQTDPLESTQLLSPISTRSPSKISTFSDASSHMSPSSSVMTCQSHSPDSLGLLTPIQLEIQSFDNFQLSGDSSIFQSDPNSSVAQLSIDGLYSIYDTSRGDTFASLDAGVITATEPMIFDFGSPMNSSKWKEVIKESPTSSPILEEWNISQAMHEGIPLESTVVPRINGRQGLELDNTAREHPLYHNVSPQADGFYHCPWEKDPVVSCQHKPEKLKCNYDKCVDSHLKPYRCKVLSCKDLHFSSTACLLRHEREAHAMHGHGDKPFLCTYEGCDRGIPGKGFPRHWNLRDHQRRVHNDSGHTKFNTSGSVSPSAVSSRVRKRKSSNEALPSCKKIITSQTIPKPRESILVERYNEKQQLLLKIAGQLQDHKNVENLPLLRKANECIKVMVQTSQRMNLALNRVNKLDES
ncbi:hypothetical protein K3495_g4948 [Podosphaera aphanis]|nr:hypothetical protein K3495_g4948 [Podosphaera aphanis]